MPETQEASIGWGGEVWIGTDATVGTLTELVQVVSFGLPQDEVERVETTHLKSPNRRREYTAGLVDGGEIEITLNFRPGSDTDILIEAALLAGDERSLKFVVPHLGVASRDYASTGIVTGYDKGSVAAGEKMEATVTVAITGAVTATAHA